MNRRRFLTRLGIGGAGVAAVAVPGASYAAGVHVGETRLSGHYHASVRSGQQRGHLNVWWSAGGPELTDKVLALTFDDGPTKQFTGEVLDVLERYEVPATFFLIGEMVNRRPDDVRRMLDAGHEVANHTFDHHSAAIQSPDQVRRTMELGADAIASISGERPHWFRPVRGDVTGALMDAAHEIGHEVALWSVSRDPGTGPRTADDDVDAVRGNYVDAVHEGALVIFHDGIGRSAFEVSGPDDRLLTQRRAEIDALPGVIERYLADGYRLLTVTDLIDGYGRQP